MTTLDFKLGYLYKELSDRIATIAADTDNSEEIVEKRLLELLNPNLPVTKNHVHPTSTRYFVEGSKVGGGDSAQDKFYCTRCPGLSFKTKQEKQFHWNHTHRVQSSKPPLLSGKKFPCPVCGIGFKSQGLSPHVRSIHREYTGPIFPVPIPKKIGRPRKDAAAAAAAEAVAVDKRGTKKTEAATESRKLNAAKARAALAARRHLDALRQEEQQKVQQKVESVA